MLWLFLSLPHAPASPHSSHPPDAFSLLSSPTQGRDGTVTHLLPVILSLLRDEAPDARLAVIARLEAVHAVVGLDLLAQSLLPAVEALASDRHWRVRLAVIEHVPALAAQLGPAAVEARLGPQVLHWLGDAVAAVRDAASRALARLASSFGPEWAAAHLLPPLLALGAAPDPHYLRRETVLAALAALAPAVSHDVLAGTLLPALTSASSDRVPNVRFAVAKQLERVAPLVEPGAVDRAVRPTLAALAEDADADVRFFARRALASCDGVAAA